MFPEHRDLISQLKVSHTRFQSLFEKHNNLDDEIARLEEMGSNAYSAELAKLKKEKLHLKDSLYAILQEENSRTSV